MADTPGSTADPRRAYVSVFEPAPLAGTSVTWVHVDDLGRLRDSIRLAPELRPEHRLKSNADYPVPRPNCAPFEEPEPVFSETQPVFKELPPTSVVVESGLKPPAPPPARTPHKIKWYGYLTFWWLGEWRREHEDREIRKQRIYESQQQDYKDRQARRSRAEVAARDDFERKRADFDARSRAYQARQAEFESNWQAFESRRVNHEMRCRELISCWEAARIAWLSDRERDLRLVEHFRSGYEGADEEAVAQYFKVYLRSVPFPAWCPDGLETRFDSKEGVLLIELRLPHFPSLSVMKTRILKGGPETIPASTKETKDFANHFPYMLSLRMISEAAHRDNAGLTRLVCCNGYVIFDDPATGRERRDVILSVAATPVAIRELALERVDPEACFKKLRGVAGPRLSELIPVKPIVQFNTADKRFIEAKDVLHEVEGQNLATIDWQDFEYLIRELFEKEFAIHGAEVRVTQASHDRGVDAVIFDPDPLRGGKTIIQAKRYSTTVDVSAVRDLLGTIHAEGANKGILVTTSNFGPDSYEFAKDKPITLLNGANLLHYLSKHGYNARIDLKQAREVLKENNGRPTGRF